jgi:hypothetical protein
MVSIFHGFMVALGISASRGTLVTLLVPRARVAILGALGRSGTTWLNLERTGVIR